jgi:hypothetical protein
MLILKIAAGVMLGIILTVFVVLNPLLIIALAYYVGVVLAVFAVLWLVSLPLRGHSSSR